MGTIFVVYSLTTTIFDYMYDVHVYVRIIIPQIHQCISMSLNMHIFKLQIITLYAYFKHYFSLVFTHIFYGNFWHLIIWVIQSHISNRESQCNHNKTNQRACNHLSIKLKTCWIVLKIRGNIFTFRNISWIWLVTRHVFYPDRKQKSAKRSYTATA